MDCYKFILYKVWNVHCSGCYAFFSLIELTHYFLCNDSTFLNSDFLVRPASDWGGVSLPGDTWISVFLVFALVAQYLKNDLMHQFDSQVNDFMDSLIEESATLEPAPLPVVFSPPLSDKERNKLRCCHLTDPKSAVFFFSAAIND